MGIVDGEQMRGAFIRTAAAGVGEVFEAVVGDGAVNVLRILKRDDVLFAEAVVDADVELVIGTA